MEISSVWLALGSLLIAAGAIWQMWIAARELNARLGPLLRALDDLTREQRAAVLNAQDVRPWNVRKRRQISKLARDETLGAMTAEEKALLVLSDRAGWAWSMVCVGSLAAAVGSIRTIRLA